MPPKKSNLNNARSREARRKRVERAHQSAEQIATRNAAQRIRTAEGRAQESQEQRDERLISIKHFEESQFENHRQDGRIKLKPNAVPTLFDVPPINPLPRKYINKISNDAENSQTSQVTAHGLTPMLEESQKVSRHWCIVPMCGNTSIKTPEKTFIQVPINETKRNLWLNMVRRNPEEFSKISRIFVCEDHFDLEEDMQNYWSWKIMGGRKYMKPNAIPHKFNYHMTTNTFFSEDDIACEIMTKRARIFDSEQDLSDSSTSEILPFECVNVEYLEVKEEKRNVGISAKPAVRSIEDKSSSPALRRLLHQLTKETLSIF